MTTFGQFLRTLTLTTSLLGTSAMAQSSVSTINDTVTNPDGTPFNGTLAITWTGTSASSANGAAPYSTSTKIYNGVLSVRLAPSTTAYPPAFYLAVYTSADGRTSWVETWQVGPSTAALNLSQVRSAVPSSTGVNAGTLGIGQVTGLSSYLNAISSSLNTMTSTVGSFNTTVGGITSTVTNLQTTVNNLVTNATSAAAKATFVDGETPQGAIGSASVFQLANAPAPPSSLMLSQNGILLTQGQDYSLASATLTFLNGAMPQVGDTLLASYRLGTSGQSSFVDQETPRGAVNGTNTVFALSAAPASASNLKLFKNGFLLVNNVDYSVSGSTITFSNLTSTPGVGDVLLAYYRIN